MVTGGAVQSAQSKERKTPEKRTEENRHRIDAAKETETAPSPGAEELQFRCSSCGAVYPESWNRCPKCGGEVVPVRPEIAPERKRVSGISGNVPAPGMVRSEISAAPAVPVKTVKKVKKVNKRAGTRGKGESIFGQRKGAVPSTSPALHRTAPHVSPSNSASEPHNRPDRIRFSDPDMDSLFEPDPLLDGFGEDTDSPSSKWRETSLSAPSPLSAHPHQHTEVREMLSELIGGGLQNRHKEKVLVCQRCGFVQPPGDWDFCMKCGARLRK